MFDPRSTPRDIHYSANGYSPNGPPSSASIDLNRKNFSRELTRIFTNKNKDDDPQEDDSRPLAFIRG
jgi:hypothetical protein